MLLLTIAVLPNAQTCRNTGSLNIQGGSIVDQATTYIIPTYNITCDGVVTGWKFCFQINDVPSVNQQNFHVAIVAIIGE